MKFYCAMHCDSHNGTMYAWGRNKTEAKQKAIDEFLLLGDKGAIDALTIKEFQIKAGAPALIAWLNAYFKTDNG